MRLLSQDGKGCQKKIRIEVTCLGIVIYVRLFNTRDRNRYNKIGRYFIMLYIGFFLRFSFCFFCFFFLVLFVVVFTRSTSTDYSWAGQLLLCSRSRRTYSVANHVVYLFHFYCLISQSNDNIFSFGEYF
jgi:hypothetical protein